MSANDRQPRTRASTAIEKEPQILSPSGGGEGGRERERERETEKEGRKREGRLRHWPRPVPQAPQVGKTTTVTGEALPGAQNRSRLKH